MDRLSQLRGEPGGSRDSTLDTTSPPSEAYMSANENSSKYYTLSDSMLDITPDVTLASTSSDPGCFTTDDEKLISNLSPISKKELIDSYKIGTQIEAANILSGGVDIFDDNENSFDGDELVIDDNVETNDKSNDIVAVPAELIIEDAPADDEAEDGPAENVVEAGHVENVVEAGHVEDVAKADRVEDVAEADNVEDVAEADHVKDIVGAGHVEDVAEAGHVEDVAEAGHVEDVAEADHVEDVAEADHVEDVAEVGHVEDVAELEPPLEPDLMQPEENEANREMEVVLQIDGNNVDAIDIGNGLYLYRKVGHDELAAIQIIDDNNPQHSFKFLKVRDNAEGNLEVYEEIEIEVPKEVPTNEKKPVNNNTSKMPVVDSNNVASCSSNNKVPNICTSPQKEPVASTSKCQIQEEAETTSDFKPEVNLNGKMMKFSESRKSPVVGSFTPMTYHSTPNKEGKPLTKTMVDLQLHPNRHSDNVKKTIEVHTDNVKLKPAEKEKDPVEKAKTGSVEIEVSTEKSRIVSNDVEINKVSPDKKNEQSQSIEEKCVSTELKPKPLVITEKDKDVIAEKCVVEVENKEGKSSITIQESAKSEINLDKSTITIKADKPIAIKKSAVVFSKPDESAIALQSSTVNSAVISTSVTVNSVCNKESETHEENVVEPNKPTSKNIDPVLNSSKDKDPTIKNKTTSVPSALKKDTALNVEKEENKTLNKIVEVDKTNSQIKVQNSSSKTSNLCRTSLTHKHPKANVESSMKSVDEIIKFPLEAFSDVSSTSMNIESDESKAESITLYAIDTDESVSLITPSNATKTTKDKNNIDIKISEAFTKISKISDENTCIDKQNSMASLSTKKVSTLEVQDHVDSLASKSVEKPKVIETSYSQKAKNVETAKGRSIPVFSGKVTSVSVPKVIPLEKTAQSISVSVVKSENTKQSIVRLVPKVKSEKVAPADPNATKLKPLEKETHSTLSGTKNPETVANLQLPKKFNVTSTPNVKPSAQHIPIPDAKDSVKSSQSPTPKSKSKPLEVLADSTPVPNVKPLEKTMNSIPTAKPAETTAICSQLSEVKPLQITSTISNKTGKPDGHVPIVTIANKPSSKLILPIVKLKNDGIKKVSDNATIPKQISKAVDNNSTHIKSESQQIKEPTNILSLESKPVNNNHTPAVPFGKWTDINRQEFLNKFKEVKAPVNINSKQIKNSNDLNRRDVLQKIDSQRAQTIINNATAKAQEKVNIIKNEVVFSNKGLPPKIETKIPIKNENADVKAKQVSDKVCIIQDSQHTAITSTVPTNLPTVATIATVSKTEPAPRDLSTATMASLIDKTIEDMINRVVPCKSASDEPVQVVKMNASETESTAQITVSEQEISKPGSDDLVSLDDIEMKMNELHGIPFVERPPHELPKIPKADIKTYGKTEKSSVMNKIPNTPNTISSTSELKTTKDNVIDVDSEDEIIEHEPITGDLELRKRAIVIKLPTEDKKTISEKSASSVVSKKVSDKEAIITETDFDKFARRNSVSCENYLAVNFDQKAPQNVEMTKEKDHAPKVSAKPEEIRIENKSKLPHKQTIRHNLQTGKIPSATKFGVVVGDSSNKKYQSKIHTAYQTALTAKHQAAHPITIIEDKPVKVLFVESSAGFVPSQLNVQGQELSPVKKSVTELDISTKAGNDSVDSDILEVIDENKQQDKTKTKHQRKQVLTPVEAPDLELIQPSDIGLETSPKKKKKTDEIRSDKQSKNVVHKKSYLLGRNATTDDKTSNSQVSTKETLKEVVNRSDDVIEHKDAASAIDNLVKAAELLDNQAENLKKTATTLPDSQPNTPVKRGRGRPRKYPLSEGAGDKTPSPQKKPRLIDAKPVKQDSISDEHDEETSEEEMIRENWTMGKINENIICPICNKLFRSENVVFKHVKHCTGVSPNRSDSDKRSPRRSRLSQESEDMDMDYEISVSDDKKNTPRKRKSKESAKSETKPEETKFETDKDVIVIKDTPDKEKPEKHDKEKDNETKKETKSKVFYHANNLVCEFCGKKFRQLTHLVTHSLQHKKDESSKLQVFSCEVCKKEFRKLHHLVQHRIIHNPGAVPKRTPRKSSSEQNDTKSVKEQAAAKQYEDPSAAFRCEPCDKSFRKLHHLVEHRETHDGINRQKPSAPPQPIVEKSSPPPQCEICKKTFRKLHHLIEHKEQHADTSSEKSDDKSVKSALSTKDIIHECSLCYMVFPNEHSLTKHSVICSKKKRQSKQPKDVTENESIIDEQKSEEKEDEGESIDEPKILAEDIIDGENSLNERNTKDAEISSDVEKVVEIEKPTVAKIKQNENEIATDTAFVEKPLQKDVEIKSAEIRSVPAKRDLTKSDGNIVKEKSVVPEKIKKIENKEVKTQDIPKKRTPLKDKVAATVTKRKKTIEAPLPVKNEVIPSVESSDDEIRYMFNPKFKLEELSEENVFTKVRASKRNSLQIERPRSLDLIKRRTSVQHPLTIPRLKPKAIKPKLKAAEPKPKTLEATKSLERKSKIIEPKTVLPTTSKHISKKSEIEAALSTDSDDSDVKYSFPKTAPEVSKSAQNRRSKETEKKIVRKSLAEKRKSLTGVAKRKSLGKTITAKHIVDASSAKPIKKRSAGAEYRCDCGQLFSSAALLARHTSLAHTPPRIRRRRSPPPADTRPSTGTDKHKLTPAKKDGPSASTRKSSAKIEAITDTRKSTNQNKPEVKSSGAKTRRPAAHSGVPVPEKMRKLMQKNKK